MDAALAASPLRLLDDDTYRTMCASLLPPMFIPTDSFQGARHGYAFKLAHGRLGYHVDHVSSSLVAVSLGRLSLTCRALLARTAPLAETMRLRRFMVRLVVPTLPSDKAPSAADMANAESSLHALRDSGVQYPGDIEEATATLALAREWRQKACDLLGQRFAAALAACCICHASVRGRCRAHLINVSEEAQLYAQTYYERLRRLAADAHQRRLAHLPGSSVLRCLAHPACLILPGPLPDTCVCLSDTCVAWLISPGVLDELNLLKRQGANTPQGARTVRSAFTVANELRLTQWEKQVQLHCFTATTNRRLRSASIGAASAAAEGPTYVPKFDVAFIRESAANVLRIFEALPSEAELMTNLPSVSTDGRFLL